jgi:hypothetical protein
MHVQTRVVLIHWWRMRDQTLPGVQISKCRHPLSTDLHSLMCPLMFIVNFIFFSHRFSSTSEDISIQHHKIPYSRRESSLLLSRWTFSKSDNIMADPVWGRKQTVLNSDWLFKLLCGLRHDVSLVGSPAEPHRHIVSPGENLWHWHASATACVLTWTPAQWLYMFGSIGLEIIVMWVKLFVEHLLKWTTKQADIQMIKIVTL